MKNRPILHFLFFIFITFGAYSQGHVSILGGYGFTSLNSTTASEPIDLSGLGAYLAIRGSTSAKWAFGFCTGYQNTSETISKVKYTVALIPATFETQFLPGSKNFRALLGFGLGLYMVNLKEEGVKRLSNGFYFFDQPFNSNKTTANFGFNPQLGFRVGLSKTVFLDALYRIHLVKTEEVWNRMNAINFGLTLYFEEPDQGDSD